METKVMLQQLYKDIGMFLMDTSRNNAWFENETLQIYVRRGLHIVHGEVVDTIDLPNTTIFNDEDRGKGIFKDILINMMRLCRDTNASYLYCENVMPEQLQEYFLENGWVGVPTEPYPSFAMPISRGCGSEGFF